MTKVQVVKMVNPLEKFRNCFLFRFGIYLSFDACHLELMPTKATILKTKH